MPVTKLTKQIAPYHTWDQTEVTVSGQIIGVQESLGHPADTVTIIASGSNACVKFNVCQKVFGTHASEPSNARWLGADAAFYTRPLLVDEVDNSEARDPIYIYAGTSQTWTRAEVAISDIKFLQIAVGLTIIAT